MADIFTRQKRSAVMSAIRSRGNAATELRLIALFRSHGVGPSTAALPADCPLVFSRPVLPCPHARTHHA